MNVIRVTDQQLPDFVAAALGWKLDAGGNGGIWHGQDGPVCKRADWQPHKDWAQAGPIIEAHWRDITGTLEIWHGRDWREKIDDEPGAVLCNMMRAFVDVMLGGLPT